MDEILASLQTLDRRVRTRQHEYTDGFESTDIVVSASRVVATVSIT